MLKYIQKHKYKATPIALILMLTFSVILTTLPTLNAQPSSAPTNAYLTVSPNPAGLNQEVTLQMWLLQIEPTANTVLGGRWENYTVLITKPDGTTLTLGPFTADDASFAYAIYTPDQIGVHTLEFNFPGKHVTGTSFFGTPLDIQYEASIFTTTLTVQEEPATASPQTPLPTGYWSRPINAQNFDWTTISGNWLGTSVIQFAFSYYNSSGCFNPYTTAPNTGHIVWTKPLIFGGLIGGEFEGTPVNNYYNGKSYEPAFGPPVIINGVLYYNAPAANAGEQGFYAVDLRTGETLWHQNITSGITCGQVYNFLSPNQQGGIPYLWDMPSSGIWSMYDAVTGNLILQVANATLGGLSFGSQGNIVNGPNGELLVYVLGANSLALWNSSLCILASPGSTEWLWRPQTGATLDWRDGIEWNVTTQSIPGQTIQAIDSGVILAITGSIIPQDWQLEIGYDMNTGEQLWVQNRTTPPGQTAWGLMGTIADGVYTEYHSNTLQWYGYDITSGEQVWGPTEPYTNAWASIAENNVFTESAYGIQYSFCIDGLHALDITTGERLWDFYADPAGLDFPGYSTLPFENNMLYTIADGKVIASTGDSHGVPMFREAKLYAVDAYSGNETWSINGYYQFTMPVADGYLVAFNGYDNMLYCFGKGQTGTTVTVPEAVQPLGTPVLIKGAVTDQSPGETCLGIPAAGTPVIADEDMSAWMEYLYQQQTKPEDAKGVSVHITAIDPNGNFQDIGYVTSDITGGFKKMWLPPVPGEYTITATFEGSESYFSSEATTYMGVSEAPSPAEQMKPELTEPEPTEPTGAFALGTTEIAIIAAVAVACAIGIVSYWALRKRK